MRQRGNYREDTAVATDIAAVTVASDAATKAYTQASSIAALAVASLDENKANNIKAVIFDLATSIDIDDVSVAEGLDQANDVVVGSETHQQR